MNRLIQVNNKQEIKSLLKLYEYVDWHHKQLMYLSATLVCTYMPSKYPMFVTVGNVFINYNEQGIHNKSSIQIIQFTELTWAIDKLGLIYEHE